MENAPRQQFLFPDNSTFCQAAERFQPFGYPANRRLSHFLFLYSATTTLYFFFLFFCLLFPLITHHRYRPTNLPTTERREASNFPTGRVMNSFLWGSSYRCYKCTGMFYILHPNQTMECQVWLLMDENMPRLPQQLAYYPHIIILAIRLQQRNLEPLRFDSTYLYVP